MPVNPFRDGFLAGLGIGSIFTLVGVGYAWGLWIGFWIFIPMAVAWLPNALRFAERRLKRHRLRRFIREWEHEHQR